MNKKMVFGAVAALVFLVGCGEQNEDLNEDGTQLTDSVVTYDCQGEDVKADFNNDVDPQTVDLFFIAKNTEITLPNVEAASGARYSDGDITFWAHQEEAILSMESTGQSLNCVEVNDSNDNEVITDANGNIVTPGCQSWFDGCNTCKVSEEPGMPMACTRMFCDPTTMQPAKCMDENSIKNDKKDCADGGGVWSEDQNSCFEDPSTMAEEGEK